MQSEKKNFNEEQKHSRKKQFDRSLNDGASSNNEKDTVIKGFSTKFYGANPLFIDNLTVKFSFNLLF